MKRACDLCGKHDHTVKNCQRVVRAYVSYADTVKRTSGKGQPVSTQMLSDCPERPEEEVVAEEEEPHLDIEEEVETAGGSRGPVLAEVIIEMEKEVESLVG